jgi:hypothetical protein
LGAGAGAHDVGGAAYRAWRRDSKEHALLQARRRSSAGVDEVGVGRPRERKASKGKGKAVAFVVGLPSSGEEGDVEPDDGAEQRGGREDGLEGVFNFDRRWEGAIAREPTVEDMIRSQVCHTFSYNRLPLANPPFPQIRKPSQTVDSLDLDSLLPAGIADYTFVEHPAQPSSDSVDPRDASREAADASSKLNRVLLGKGKFSEVVLVRKGDTEVRHVVCLLLVFVC